MKDEEMAEISESGYQKLIQQDMKERDRLKELYQEDLIGALSDLYTYVGMEIQESREESKILSNLESFLHKEKLSYSVSNKILCLFTNYGIAAEENGFRRGFQVAMRLCMQGITGGAVS